LLIFLVKINNRRVWKGHGKLIKFGTVIPVLEAWGPAEWDRSVFLSVQVGVRVVDPMELKATNQGSDLEVKNEQCFVL
jgi:hypothetical protein